MIKVLEYKDIELRAFNYSTKSTWGHKCEIRFKREFLARVSIRYHNRTWEKYQYHDILNYALRICDKKYANIMPLEQRYELYKIINK